MLLGLLLASCADPGALAVPAGATASATGFFVDRSGLLVTAAHAITGCGEVDVASERVGSARARLVVADAESDLALLRAERSAPGALAVASKSAPAAGGALALGYPVLGLASPLVEAAPVPVAIRAQPAAPDPRFARWWQDPRIGHGWSGAPVLEAGKFVGVILSVVTDPQEQRRLTGRTAPGLAAGADAASVTALLARIGVSGAASGPARDAVVRVFCLR